MAAVTRVAFGCLSPLRVPRFFRLPALSWWAGQSPGTCLATLSFWLARAGLV
jgi:hypothetical protein